MKVNGIDDEEETEEVEVGGVWMVGTVDIDVENIVDITSEHGHMGEQADGECGKGSSSYSGFEATPLEVHKTYSGIWEKCRLELTLVLVVYLSVLVRWRVRGRR